MSKQKDRLLRSGVAGVVEKKEYVSDNARLMPEWDWEKNREQENDPRNLTCGSGRKVWWKCNKGHEWQATIASRNSGCRCPYCAGVYVMKGETDLQTVNPTVAKEWNFERNNSLRPTDVMPNSGRKVWWKCNKGHEWQATIGSRNRGYGCPYCAGLYVAKGETDLQTVNPALTKEWDFEKNNSLRPEGVLPNSHTKVW